MSGEIRQVQAVLLYDYNKATASKIFTEFKKCYTA